MRGQPRMRAFVVTEPGTPLASVVEQLAPGDAHSIEQGRVFVDCHRIMEPQQRLAKGSQVTWYLQRPADSSSGDVAFSIVARRGDWVIATKPSSWVCEPDRTGRGTSLREAVAVELGAREVHVLTRLDVGVSGLVLLGLSHHACSLAAQLQSRHEITKEYFGLVTGIPESSGTWNGPPCGNREATTEFRTVAVGDVTTSGDDSTRISLLSFTPITGRKHQIRIHASHHRLPLLGDGRYGGLTRLVREDGAVISVRRIMLHAYRLNIPWERHIWSNVCAVPADLTELWTGFGGDARCLQP